MLLRIVLSACFALLAGFGAIYVFNRVPAKWLCDYGEEPDKEMWESRIRLSPFGVIFIFFFMAGLSLMWDRGPLYQLAGTAALWFLLLVALADIKYRIIPDQFLVALAVTAIGFIPFQSDFLSPLYGALLGGASLLMVGIVGRWIYKKEVMGFGDVKLMAAVGLTVGMKGTAIILILTIFSAGILMGIGLLSGRLKRQDEQALGPYIAAAAATFILFQPWLLMLANWYMGAY